MNSKEVVNEPRSVDSVQESRASVFLQNRLAEVRDRIFDSGREALSRKRRITFFVKGDEENIRRDNLPRLSPSLKAVLVDEEGILYLRRWRRSKITPEAQVFGTQQKGRDYFRDPPKTKRPVELEIIAYPKGIETFIRGCDEVAQGYSVTSQEGREVYQIMKISERLLELQRIIANFENLSDYEVRGVLSDNLAFLKENGLVSPKNWEKEQIRDLLTRGFTDSLGRRNVLASLMRVYSASVHTLRRAEISVPATSGKFTSIAEVARFKREMVRAYFETSCRYLKYVLQDQVFDNYDITNLDVNIWKEEARRVWRTLFPVFAGLEWHVDFRPYVLASRKVVEHFGYEKLLKGTRTRDFQIKRKKAITITELLGSGRFDQAKRMVEKCVSILEGVLDAAFDIETFKSSKLSPSEKFLLHKERIAKRRG